MDENDQIEHRFDRYIKKSASHRASRVLEEYVRQSENFPVRSNDELEKVAAPPFVSRVEKHEIVLGSTPVFLDNEDLARALRKLKPEERQIIQMSYFDGYEDEAIAERLNIKTRSAERKRQRALSKLKKFIGRLRGGDK